LCDLAQRYDIPLHWHCGFRLAVPGVPEDFRGPAMPRLARRRVAETVCQEGIHPPGDISPERLGDISGIRTWKQ
jgi:hypothetical protein